MLSLRNIHKEYKTGAQSVEALKGVSINFRKSEFVSILGQSGCGKTTMLNIIGGLDRFTSGDLIINGKSTKKFSDKEWDTYRNHSIGFVFQSYNLIPHQSVLKNVELALTLSGVKRAERRKRAIDALTKVGLGDQIHKRPNQMSGGQMQRVAIARAIVNDPDILLADEPTGALDTQTSIQVMEILKEISKDRLIIMVTHNPELAQQYSSRIIKLLDGNVVDDSNPFNDEEKAELQAEIDKAESMGKTKVKKNKKKSMSMLTALSLSFNNLLTKKARTILTAFAGSIGIIGIALILSLSSGVNTYVNNVQKDTLSNYPISIESTSADMTSAFAGIMQAHIDSDKEFVDDGKLHVKNDVNDIVGKVFSEVKTNDLKAFKKYIESDNSDIKKYTSDVKYRYNTQLNVFNQDTSNGVKQANPSTVLSDLGMDMGNMSEMNPMMSTNIFTEIIGDENFVKSQFDVIAGRLPNKYDEVILMAGENNDVSDYTLYSLGLLDVDEIKDLAKDIRDGKEYTSKTRDLSYDDILNTRLSAVNNTQFFQKQSDGSYLDMRDDEKYMSDLIKSDSIELKVVGIVRPSTNSSTTQKGGYIGYTHELMERMVNDVNASEIVKTQKKDMQTDVFTGKPFSNGENKSENQQFDMSKLTDEQKAQFAAMSEAEQQQMMKQFAESSVSTSTYESNVKTLGIANLDEPSSIEIYPIDFEAKDKINEIIDKYNEGKDEDDQIEYTDMVGIMMSSVTTIINAISYILIAFVGISLVVSSIMIGIITYISVLERTKEIGVLRSIGASKRDISRVFNAETLIVGLTAGLIGIGVTLLLLIPTNIIIYNLTDIGNLAQLPWLGGIILVLISMFLTFIAGLIPSKIAAKKDPVVALRSE